MIKILQILPTDTPGIQQLASSIENSFPSEKFIVITAYLNPISSQHSSPNTKHFNFTKKETKGLKIKVLLKILKYCRKEQFDIIITHRFKPLYLMLIISKFLKTPKYISVIHGFDDFSRTYRRLTLNLLWSNRWQFVAISDAVANYLTKLGKNIDSHQVTTINNAINVTSLTKRFKTKQQSRSTLGLDPKTLVFGTIGRLVPLKRHLHLIKAFEVLLQEQPNSHLVIIGEGRSRTDIEKYLANNNLQTKVTLTGHLNNAADYLQAFDVFVLPSLKEGFGMVILEAMAAKLPVIASRTGGIPYILGDLGHLVPLHNAPPDLKPHQVKHAVQSQKHY